MNLGILSNGENIVQCAAGVLEDIPAEILQSLGASVADIEDSIQQTLTQLQYAEVTNVIGV